MKRLILTILVFIAILSKHNNSAVVKFNPIQWRIAMPENSFSQRYQKAICNIKKYETFQEYQYVLFGDTLEGYGSKTSVYSSKAMTEVQAAKLLHKDYHDNINIMRYYLDTTISENVLYLLGMLSYNTGCVAVLDSRMFQLIKNKGCKSDIIEEYLGFKYIDGRVHKQLEQRRKDEINIWLK